MIWRELKIAVPVLQPWLKLIKTKKKKKKNRKGREKKVIIG